MKKTIDVLRKSAGVLDLPADILAGLPRIDWVVGSELSVEPHNGLLSYGMEEITIQTRAGVLAVRGKELGLKLMNSSRITISGKVCSVEHMVQNG